MPLSFTSRTGTLRLSGNASGIQHSGTAAQGDILYHSGTSWSLLVAGTSGHFLKTLGTGANPVWATAVASPAGASLTLQYNNASAFGGMSGTSWDDTNRSLTMTGATVTTSNPILNLTQTWSAGGVTFTGLKFNATDTASAAASLLLDLQVATVSKASVSKGGHVVSTASFSASTPAVGVGAANTGFTSSGGNLFTTISGSARTVWDPTAGSAGAFMVNSGFTFAWSSGNVDAVGVDTALGRTSAGIVEVNNGTAGTLRDFKARRLVTPMTSELTIASDAITVTGSYHRVDTEADGATDDLSTINGGTDGGLLVLRAEDAGRTVVVKDGVGNIQAEGDMSLDNTQDTITLIFDATLSAWLELARTNSGA